MVNSGRLLVIAAALSLGVHAGVANAQTVVARKLPAGATVELVVNGATVGTGTPDAMGDARVPFDLQAQSGKPEMDATVHVDVCSETLRRVLVADRNQAPPVPEPGCSRKDVIGVFWIKKVTTLVVDTGSPNATVFLRQGPVDLTAKPISARWDEVPTGLVAFGGAGLSEFRDAFTLQCGDASQCTGGDSHTTYLVGGTLWLNPFLGVEGAFLKPPGVNANGTGTGYQFNSVLSSRIYAINGKVGVPIGRARLYGQGGTNYHRATLSVTETLDDTTITVGGISEAVRGGTQTLELNTGGWGWQVGAGLEIWVKPSIGIFAEASRTRLKGEGLEGGHGTLDDYLNAAFVGLKLKIGR
ncbi:MAG: outer membrane beta-barrel protein [Vicinamibacterales bacterium]